MTTQTKANYETVIGWLMNCTRVLRPITTNQAFTFASILLLIY